MHGTRRPGRPAAAVDIDRARRLLGEGRSKAAVASALGVSRATLYRCLAGRAGVSQRHPGVLDTIAHELAGETNVQPTASALVTALGDNNEGQESTYNIDFLACTPTKPILPRSSDDLAPRHSPEGSVDDRTRSTSSCPTPAVEPGHPDASALAANEEGQ